MNSASVRRRDTEAESGARMLSEYRQRFGDFHTEFYREDYIFRSGHEQGCEITRIRDEYSDLFKPSAITELRAKLEETSEHRETDRSSLKRLIAFAVEGYLQSRAQEVSDEIEDYEANALIDWHSQQGQGQGQGQGQKIPFRSST